MYTAEFFLGFPIAPSYANKLSALDPDYYALITQGESYLREIEYEGKRYLGKAAGSLINRDSFETLEANIYSLLNKLFPEHPYEQTPLVLFPLLIKWPAASYAN